MGGDAARAARKTNDMRKLLAIAALLLTVDGSAQITNFEKSGGLASATYDSCIAYYKALAAKYPKVHLKTMGPTDSGNPLHLLLYSNDGSADPKAWYKKGKVVILVNNGIHPGEPDGIDASMMLLRDIAAGKVRIPDNIGLAIIPVYNIGGSLNRSSYSRVNQNGPLAYGFRGNAQNLDLNRDFTKCDSRNALSFSYIFHYVDPHILIDNHVSDGADYQHTMTLLATIPGKLGGETGRFLHDTYLPALFEDMKEAGDQMVPYVNFEEADPQKGWDAYYDSPRYSSGYAALFQTVSFMPETHMLKPYADRVHSTYRLIQIMIREAAKNGTAIIANRAADRKGVAASNSFALSWTADKSRWDSVDFKGYTPDRKPSEVSGLPRLYYDHTRPFEKEIKFFDYFIGKDSVTKPRAYLIPQGWHTVTDLLAINNVPMQRLEHDSTVTVDAYHIDSYKAAPRAYEKHHRNTNVVVSVSSQTLHFRKGDVLVPMGFATDRFVVEMLEPTGDDSYFSWNFFDAILQEKEGYSAYRLEDVAGAYLKEHPELQDSLENRRKADPAFAGNGAAQLDYVYKHSVYFEPAYLRYPVYRLP